MAARRRPTQRAISSTRREGRARRGAASLSAFRAADRPRDRPEHVATSWCCNTRWGAARGHGRASSCVGRSPAATSSGRALAASMRKPRPDARAGPRLGALARASVAGPFVLGFVIVYPLIVLRCSGPGGSIKWIDNFGIQILIYIMLGWGLNIVVGLAGLLDLGYVAFYAVGAYSYALLANNFGLSFWILLPLAGILAAFWGMILGFPVLRLRGDYLAIVTLAFGEIIRLVLINWVGLTNGYAGISGIPRPTFFGIPFNAGDNGFAAVFGPAILARSIAPSSCLLILALALADRLRHPAAAAAPDRPRLGSPARGRDRLPLARHQHHEHQAHRLCHRRLVRWLCRRFLRGPPGLHLARELRLLGIGHHSRHRRARRHGQPDRRRHRGCRDDRRHRDHARARFPQGRSSAMISTRRSTACCCSASPW